jgi:hypothetical protein
LKDIEVGKILFTGYLPNGVEESGYIDAKSNQEALEQLKAKGLKQIKLHTDAMTSALRTDLDGLSDREMRQMAELEAKWQKSMTFGSYLYALLKNNAVTILIGMVMFGYGYQVQGVWWMSFGVILATIGPFMGLWSYRISKEYENLLYAYTFGEWDKVRRYAANMRAAHKNNLQVITEVDSKEAIAYAVEGDIQRAKEILDQNRHYMQESMPGIYENRLASIYAIAGDYEKYLFWMKEGYKKSGQDLAKLDYVMAEARFGDLSQAEKLLSQIDTDSLSAPIQPFYHFLEGLVSYRKGDIESAYELFQAAYKMLLEYRENPAVWVPFASVTAMLAITAYDVGEKQKAEAILSDAVISVVKIYGDPQLLNALKERFPDKMC